MATVSVDITPGVRGGRPRIAGHRITVADVAIMHLSLGFSLDEIAVEYNLPLAAVYAAMAYYHTRRSEIDQQIVDDEAYAEEFQRDYPELVVSKLPPVARPS